MSSGDGPVMGKPPIGTPGSRNKTPSTTPRSSGSTPRQTSASAGRTSNGRPAVPGQVTKSARPNSVTKDTEATLRRKIERLKSELDSRTSKPTSKPGHLKSAGDTKSVSANRASSTPLVRTTRNSKNSLSKSLSFEGAASGSKDSTKVQTPPNSQPKASTARRSGGGLPEARLAKTLPGSITDSIGDGKGGKPAPVPVPRGLPRSNSKPDLKKGTSSISDPPKSSSSVSELPDSPASSQGTSLKRTNTYLVKKGQPSASTRVPVIHALPKAENAKTAVVENTSPWLRRNEGDTVCTSEDPKGEPPPCLNKGSNERRIPKAAASISESSSVSDGIEVCGKMNPDYEHREKTVSNDKVDVTDQPEDLSSIGEGPAPEIKEGSDILQTEAHIKRETGFNVEAGRTLHEGLNIQEEEEPLQHAERKEEDNFIAELKKSPNSQVDDQQTQVETTRSKGGKEELEHLVARQQQEITTLRKENEHLPSHRGNLKRAPTSALGSAAQSVIGSGTGTGDGMDERSRLHGGPALSRDAPREHRTRQQVEELQMERKPTEERIDKLKKRNIELSVMAKRLEEKAKQIQKQKKGDTSPTPSNGSPSPLQQTSPTAKPTEAADFYKRLLAKQRAHYLAENAQKLLAKDKEIRGLRQELDRQRPGVSPEPGLEQNSLINAEKMHLEQIIKGNAKEQLRLQRQIQLASSAPDAQTNGLGNIRYQTIEDANRALRIKCAKLEKFREENTLSEVEVTQQRLACENLEKALSEERRKCTDVSTDYQNALIQNTALARKNAELQEKINLLEHVNRECQKLRVEVNEQRQLFENTALERDILHEKVEKLERDLSLMQDAEEKRRALEQEYEQAIRELREKQEEIRRLQQEQQVAKRDHHDSVSRLAAKVKDLERKCDEQSSNFSRLSNELLALRNEAGSQLFTMTGAGAATAGPADSTAQPVVGGVGVAPSRKGTGDKEDWRKIAEEAVVTRASATSVQASQRLPSEQRIRSNLSKGGLPGRDESEPTLEKRTSYPASGDTVSRKSDHSRGIENGQLDTSDAEDLMEDLSDRIDAAILNRLNQASSITTMGPISKLAVFIARYNYDPYRDSPNDNPDAELPLTAGDYIYVYGDPDEDGFYDGELMNGQRGLVPSNFIERVAEEDIPGFMNNNGMDSDDDMKDLDFNSEEEDLNRGNLNHFAGELQSFSRSSEHHSDLEDIPEVDEDNGVKGQSRALASEEGLTSLSDIAADYVFDVPCPKKLTLERQLKNSIIISWLLPDTIAPADVQEYCVYVNGQFRTATKWDAKTRALVENIKPLETYRISVRTVTSKGTSEDAACTIMIGKDAWAAPTDLKASNVSPTSADISWLPGNSNLAHQITVNGKEVQTVKPSVYRYTLTGLSPLSVYRISVKAKSRKTSQDVKEKLATEIEFKTLPGGLPDAPLDVQVKAGASPAICVVEWLPVTITTSGLSNGAVVTGYAVYAEDTKVAEIHSPTADKVSVSLNKLKLLAARDVVVRTLSPNGFSIDSVPARIPPVLLEERRGEATLRAMEAKLSPRRNSHGGHRLTNYRRKSRRRYSHPSTMYHGAEEEDSSTHSSRSEDLHHAHDSGTALTNTKPPAAASSGKAVENATGKEDLVKADARVPREDYTSESERSELSDIAEEAEEELSDFADGSLPGLSDESEAKALKKMKRREDEQKKVQETLKYNAKPDIELDTDPELESLNKSDKCRPIQVIRQQCDFDREAEQSPHNQVLEPVPIKQTSQPGQAVPHIEITQDEARKAAASEKRSEPTGQPSLPQQPLAAPDPKSRPSTEQPPRPSSPRKSSLGEDLQPAGLMKPSTYKDYDAKSNNDRQRKLSMDSRTDETGTYEDEEDYSVSEGPEELFDDSVIRFFVALYDYDPTAMSPNVDAVDEELTFKEGDIIKVFGDKDADGFYMGELNSQRGYVPYNMVEEVEGPEQTPLNPPKRASTATSGDSPDRVGYTSSLNTTTSSPVQLLHSPINSFRIPPDARPQKMRALFDYNPQELSPNPDAEAELYFHQGDIIVVFGEMDNDGFYLGELHGQRGLVPSNFLEAIGDTPRPESVPSPQPYSTPTHQPYSPSHQAYSPSPSRESRGSRGSRGSYSSVRSDDRQTQLQHTRHQENGEAPVKGREVRSNSDVADQSGDSMGTPEHIKKKKGLLSKGKALFKKLGGDSKQKHK